MIPNAQFAEENVILAGRFIETVYVIFDRGVLIMGILDMLLRLNHISPWPIAKMISLRHRILPLILNARRANENVLLVGKFLRMAHTISARSVPIMGFLNMLSI